MNQALTELDQTNIRRLLRAGELKAAAKIYAGVMNCNMSTARGIVRRMFSPGDHPNQLLHRSAESIAGPAGRR